MPLSAVPRAPKGDQGWIFWSYKRGAADRGIESLQFQVSIVKR